uniref:Uncharacterized protein n=1 Tax=Eutreptiella gymnastica TaxID=73025 RepID=A0A7S1NPR7_9EUGL
MSENSVKLSEIVIIIAQFDGGPIDLPMAGSVGGEGREKESTLQMQNNPSWQTNATNAHHLRLQDSKSSQKPFTAPSGGIWMGRVPKLMFGYWEMSDTSMTP